MHQLLVDIVACFAAFTVGFLVRRYFIFTSGEKKTNLPFIKSFNFLTGSKDIIFTNNKVLAVNAHDRHEEMGDIFGCYFGQNMQVFCKDPDLVYKMCVENFQKNRNRYISNSLSPYIRASLMEARDDKWQTSRKAIGSVLKASKLKIDNADLDIDITIRNMLSSIDKRVREAKANKSDTIMDVYQINKNFFMQSILKIIYDTDKLVNFDQHKNDIVEELYNFSTVNYEAIARICFLVPVLTDLVRPFLGFFDYGKYLGVLTYKLEEILSKTVKAHQEDPNNSRPHRLTTMHSLINSYRKGELSRDQLMGNSVFLMLAGFTTSVDTMSALMWELAKNKTTQDHLRVDLLQYGEESTFLEQCINETLRLYPGAMTNRELGEHVYHKDFRLVKGSNFNISIYSIHRDPKYWGQDAEVWKPERFDPANVKNFHPAQFIPFGIGPRNCVGYNLARLELSKFTVQFFLKYKVELCESSPEKLQYLPLGGLPFALPITPPVDLKIIPTH